jgi:hypothetical protein
MGREDEIGRMSGVIVIDTACYIRTCAHTHTYTTSVIIVII